MNFNELIRAAAACAGGWLWASTGPAMPFGAVCTAMVMADFLTSRRLARRLRRAAPSQRQKLALSSAKLGTMMGTLLKIYTLLVLASMIDTVIMGATGLLLKFAAGAVCFWQAVSILENEAACNDARWAKAARRILIDKTERHLGITLDELRDR